MTDLENHNLSKLAEDVRKIYADKRRLKYPQYEMPPRVAESGVWSKLANMFVEKGINTRIYMDVMFQRYQPYPYPNMLLSNAAFDAYDRMKVRFANSETAKMFLYLQNDLVKTHVDNGRDLREILTDSKLDLTAAFRCCMANSANLQDIVALYIEKAENFFFLNPEYYPLLAEYAPERIKNGVGAELQGALNAK